MGLFKDLKWVAEWSRVDLSTPVSSPLASNQLAKIAFADLAGLSVNTITRTEAMQVPAIVKGRALIAGLLARHPLAAFDTKATTQAATMAPWLTTTSTPQPPRARNLWSYDDLLFGGLSCWGVQRLDDGTITDAARIAPAYWDLNPDSLGVIVDGKPASSEEVLLIEGPQEGLLTLAEETIRAALAMDAAWSKRVQSPVPVMVLQATDVMGELDDAERDEMLTKWEKKRQLGGTGYLPAGLKLDTPGATDSDSQLFIQGRNALRLDIANFLNVPAALLEGSMSTASLTYSTGVDKRNDLVDLSLGYWADALEARLSQDDVVPAGYHVAHDLTALATTVQPTRSPNQED